MAAVDHGPGVAPAVGEAEPEAPTPAKADGDPEPTTVAPTPSIRWIAPIAVTPTTAAPVARIVSPIRPITAAVVPAVWPVSAAVGRIVPPTVTVSMTRPVAPAIPVSSGLLVVPSTVAVVGSSIRGYLPGAMSCGRGGAVLIRHADTDTIPQPHASLNGQVGAGLRESGDGEAQKGCGCQAEERCDAHDNLQSGRPPSSLHGTCHGWGRAKMPATKGIFPLPRRSASRPLSSPEDTTTRPERTVPHASLRSVVPRAADIVDSARARPLQRRCCRRPGGRRPNGRLMGRQACRYRTRVSSSFSVFMTLGDTRKAFSSGPENARSTTP